MCGWKPLTKLGLNEYQSKCLATLVKNSDMTAREVSQEAEIPYSKVYSVLNSLADMSLIVCTEGRPKKYIARDEEHIVSFLTSRKEREMVRIRKQAREAKEKLRTIKSTGSHGQIHEQQTL